MILKNNRKRGNTLTFATGMKKQYSKSFPLENIELGSRAKSRFILIPLFLISVGLGFYSLILPRVAITISPLPRIKMLIKILHMYLCSHQSQFPLNRKHNI